MVLQLSLKDAKLQEHYLKDVLKVLESSVEQVFSLVEFSSSQNTSTDILELQTMICLNLLLSQQLNACIQIMQTLNGQWIKKLLHTTDL